MYVQQPTVRLRIDERFVEFIALQILFD